MIKTSDKAMRRCFFSPALGIVSSEKPGISYMSDTGSDTMFLQANINPELKLDRGAKGGAHHYQGGGGGTAEITGF